MRIFKYRTLAFSRGAILGLCALWTVGFSRPALADLTVLTTTTDLSALVAEIGGSNVTVSAICKGTQDPHFLEPKPSFMVRAHDADLVVSIGLGLEIGWLPPIIQGARNPKIIHGQRGYLEVGPMVEPLEVPHGAVTRADGDVHPEGNPHIALDPIRAGEIALGIAKRMGELDPAHSADFAGRAAALKERLTQKTAAWQQRIKKSAIAKVITFHKTLTYFLDRFHLENAAILEPLPGVPPTARHTMEVISIAQQQKVPLILVENFFEPSVAERIVKDVPGMRTSLIPVAVDGDPSIKTLDDLYERLIQVIEGDRKNG